MSNENTAQAASLEDDFMDFDLDVSQDEADGGDEVTQPEAQEVTEQIDLLEAPEYFSKEHKEIFAKLQEAEGGRDYAQHWLDQWNENQKYITQKSQKFADERRQYENQLNEYGQYQKALDPILPYWQSQGIAPAVGIAQMAYYNQMLNTDVAALVKEIANSPQAQAQGFSLDKYLEEQPYIDPHVQDQLRTLQNQNQQFQQAIGQFQQGQQQQSAQAIQNEINTFASMQDDSGQPAHPFFERVNKDMAVLLQMPNNGIDDLKTAYDRAVQYNPEIQAELAAQQEKEKAQARQAEAQKAKQASVRTSSKSKDAPKRKPNNINEIFDDFSLVDE